VGTASDESEAQPVIGGRTLRLKRVFWQGVLRVWPGRTVRYSTTVPALLFQQRDVAPRRAGVPFLNPAFFGWSLGSETDMR
jgi:hypothetical protein